MAVQGEEKIKVPCRKCGKTLFYYLAAGKKTEGQCGTIEIKCRNRECKEINQVKVCGVICE